MSTTDTLPDAPLTLSVFGVTVPIPRWSIPVFGVLAIVGVGLILYQQWRPADLVTLRQANSELSFTMREYGAHIGEMPVEQWHDADADLTVSVFRDHCVLVQRRTQATGILTRLVPDLTRSMAEYRPYMPNPTLGLRADAALASFAQGRCLNPHPGPFNTKTEQIAQCLIRVYRFWPDGCRHVQMFDPCRGTWDTNPDGSPRITWQQCVH